MKKITLLMLLFAFTLCAAHLNAQTYFSVSMNGGTTYASNPGSFAGFPWGAHLGNHIFTNANSQNISLSITDYDETNADVGNELYIRFSRVGFGTAPLNWGADNSTTLATLTPTDFTGGAATVSVNIPAGTLPIASTTDYEIGYRWILQIVGANVSGTTYINYVVDIQEQILSANTFSKDKLQAFYNTNREVVVMKDQMNGGFSIYNLMGQAVLAGDITKEINVEELKSGLYILSTEYGSLKFVK